MSIITPEELKKEVELPEQANFHGWLIHSPEKNDFLLKYKVEGIEISNTWTVLPNQAMRFNRFVRALKTIERLELQNQAIIVAAFDMGHHFFVISPILN
ncbi:hypothetical protein O1C43_003676 [Vibrio cholerae]|uniref:hypothetical protein n=1 Tax=Vibrio cholerae TaxID=666 RepID=UPI0011DBD086|nr:hypothetical protein [Vibrio cholerae]EGQ9187737.1 hypothetical protein [Vibrio cholerae]EIY4754915.1 hypothetical protein [Vibrio cholerae]EJL6306585.1 hypothetical protein [Vibrio cholerae]EKF9146125.1 hypothetical protein [Vibrio cholerae]EKF9603813.1 hypothetical protein [Vibrio cholerae]